MTALVRVGQVWKERDSRFFRLVRIVAIEGDRAMIATEPFVHGDPIRKTRARLDRFGKRYDLWADTQDQHLGDHK